MTTPAERRDKDLIRKLRDQWPGILMWAIAGATDWFADGLKPPARVTEATDAYPSEEDAFLGWIEECCEADNHA